MAILDTIQDNMSDEQLLYEWEQIKEHDKEVDLSKIKRDSIVKLRSSMLPRYREIFENELNRFNLFVSARAIGKSTNCVYGALIRAIEGDHNVLCLRKTEESTRDSIHAEFKEKIEALGLDEQHYIINNTKITLFPRSSEQIEILFKGSHNPLRLKSIKASKKFKTIVLEEAEEFTQNDIGEIEPSFRSPEGGFSFIFMMNIPPEGKQHWMYQAFYQEATHEYSHFHTTWQDNPVLFPDESEWNRWIDQKRPIYIGREGELKRKIEGVWTDPEYSVFKKIEILDESIAPNFWAFVSQSSVKYWLGVRISPSRRVIVCGESREEPFSAPHSTILVQDDDFPAVYDAVLKGAGCTSQHPSGEQELGNYYMNKTLEITKDCPYAIKEAQATMWHVEKDNRSLVNRPFKKNVQGLFLLAMRIIKGYLD